MPNRNRLLDCLVPFANETRMHSSEQLGQIAAELAWLFRRLWADNAPDVGQHPAACNGHVVPGVQTGDIAWGTNPSSGNAIMGCYHEPRCQLRVPVNRRFWRFRTPIGGLQHEPWGSCCTPAARLSKRRLRADNYLRNVWDKGPVRKRSCQPGRPSGWTYRTVAPRHGSNHEETRSCAISNLPISHLIDLQIGPKTAPFVPYSYAAMSLGPQGYRPLTSATLKRRGENWLGPFRD